MKKKSFVNKLGLSNTTTIYLKSIVVGALFLSLVYINMTRPRIVVLHSYAEDFAWVTDFNAAFRHTFKHGSNPIVYYSYMNTLNRQTTRYKNRAGQEAVRMIETISPDVIVAVYTDANEYAVQNFVNHPKIKIVFNVKNDLAKFHYDTANNVQGIQGYPAFAALNEILLLATDKRPIRIAHIGDQASSVRLFDRFMLAHQWKDIEFVDSVLVESFADWKMVVPKLTEQIDYLIVTKYLTLTGKDGKSMVPTKNVMRWTMANSKVPVVGLYTTNVEEGADLGVEDSPFEQGALMAQMTSTLLSGGEVTPKIQHNKHFIVLQHERSKIKLPQIYESFSTALKEFKR